MPFRKISDWQEPKNCSDPRHGASPYDLLNLAPGSYEYECPACRYKWIHHVPPQRVMRVQGKAHDQAIGKTDTKT